jgi:hypothetical protein
MMAVGGEDDVAVGGDDGDAATVSAPGVFGCGCACVMYGSVAAFECVGCQLRVGMHQGAPLPRSLLDLFRSALEDLHCTPTGMQ